MNCEKCGALICDRCGKNMTYIRTTWLETMLFFCRNCGRKAEKNTMINNLQYYGKDKRQTK